MRFETLQENREQVLQLTDAQAIALQHAGNRLASSKIWWGDEDDEAAETRSVIACLPHGLGTWRVTVRNAVGLVSIGDLQLAVEPKIPVNHLLYLFGRSGQFPRMDDQRVHAARSMDLWALVAWWYVEAAEQLLRRDLIRDYQYITDNLSLIRGRVDLVAAANAVYEGVLEFSCEFDEFSIDTPLNRLLKAAAGAVAGSELLGWPTRRRALVLMARMEEVGPLRAGDQQVQLERRTGHYRDAAQLAVHVLFNQGRLFSHGDTIAWTFLIPTPSMVEEGLRNVLREGLAGEWSVEKERRRLAGSMLTFNPDLVFGSGKAVGDVKYKLLSSEWVRADLYQVIAFATAYRCGSAGLFGFRTRELPALAPLLVGDVEVSELTWTAADEVEPHLAADWLVCRAADWAERARLRLP